MTAHKTSYQGPPWELIFWRRFATEDMRPTDPRYRLRMLATLDCIPFGKASRFNVLDVGCGIGLYAFGLCRRWPGATVLGVDINPGQIEYASRMARRLGLSDRLLFAVDDAERLDGIQGPFDVILATEIVEHLDHPGAFLARLSRLAAPPTTIIVSVPAAAGGSGHVEVSYRQPLPDGRYREAASPAALDPALPIFELAHRHFSAAEIEALVREAGLRIARRVPIRFDWEELGSVSPALGRLWKRVQAGRLARIVASRPLDRMLNVISFGRFADSTLLVCRVAAGG
jgi:SAM-dependent methyltransferase